MEQVIFNEARVENNLEILEEQLINTNARLFKRADAFHSLNVISTAQINFLYKQIEELTQQQALYVSNLLTLTELQLIELLLIIRLSTA